MAAPEHLIRIAELALIRDSAELEADLSSKAPTYITTLYRRFRKRAAEAMVAKAYVDPENAADLRALQADIKVFDVFVIETRGMLAEGINLDQKLSEQERNEITEFLLGEGGDKGLAQAIALGLVDAPEDSGPQGS